MKNNSTAHLNAPIFVPMAELIEKTALECVGIKSLKDLRGRVCDDGTEILGDDNGDKVYLPKGIYRKIIDPKDPNVVTLQMTVSFVKTE